jgi:hypothetical protein
MPVEGALGEIPAIADRDKGRNQQNIKRNSQNNVSCESES